MICSLVGIVISPFRPACNRSATADQCSEPPTRQRAGGSRALAAAVVLLALFDRAAEERAECAADQRSGGTMTATVDDIAENRAAGAANDQAGRPIVALAIIASVGAAIDFVVIGEDAFAILRSVAIIAGGVIV